MSLKVTLTSILVLIFSATSTALANAEWLIESENKKSGVSTNASVFWAEKFGPLDYDEILTVSGEDGDYFGIFTVACSNKTLAISLGLDHFGSGHEDIRIDDPGFVDVIFNNRFKKRFRTYGQDYPGNISFAGNDAKKLAQEILKRKTMSTVIRNNATKERIPVLFDVGGLSKAQTRFKYAGCKIS
jgi:hypothetical protein